MTAVQAPATHNTADPALTDAPAAEREVILVDYAGVGSSSGQPSATPTRGALNV